MKKLFYSIDMTSGLIVVSELAIPPALAPREAYSGIILSMIYEEIGFLGRFRDITSAYWSVDNNGGSLTTLRLRFCWGGESKNHQVSPEVFLDNINRYYPDDIDLFLFHPEIFKLCR